MPMWYPPGAEPTEGRSLPALYPGATVRSDPRRCRGRPRSQEHTVPEHPSPSSEVPRAPTPPPAPPRRTPLVTAAGGMLITAGILDVLGGIIILLAGSQALVNGK